MPRSRISKAGERDGLHWDQEGDVRKVAGRRSLQSSSLDAQGQWAGLAESEGKPPTEEDKPGLTPPDLPD